MAINKLPEFAKDGQKNTDDLVLTDGFPVLKKPARQWFNWLFNTLTTKINEIIDADFVPKIDIVDNLTTNDSTKPVSAKQAKNLKDELIKYMPLAGGVFTGTVTTRAAAVLVEGVSGVNDAVGSLRIPIASILNDGGFAPWITASTVSGLGYKQHLAIGAVRGSGLWTNSGVFIAVGDNDNRSTENFRFLTGGKIEYHREGITLPVATFLSTINTTTDSNGFIKAASPVIQLFADKIKLNSEAQQQSIEFEKLGIGNYLIKNSTGLSNDGWYVEQPKDANGNIFHAVVYEQMENGDISVKTFEQKAKDVELDMDLIKECKKNINNQIELLES
jgi:hypothetical protein